MELQEMIDERVGHVQAMRGLLDTAAGDDRGLTAEEQQEFDRRESEAERLERTIEQHATVQRASDSVERSRQAHKDLIASGEVEAGDLVDTSGERSVPASLNEWREQRGRTRPVDAPEYREAFYQLVVGGRQSLQGDQLRALEVGTDSEGGYLVPTEFERTLIDKAREYGVVRDLATVVTTSAGTDLEVPIVSSHGAATWVAEEGAYQESDEAFANHVFGAHKAGTIIKVSEELLNDSAFDLESYIADEYNKRIGVLENTGYQVGDGSGKPTGIDQDSTEGLQGTTGQTTSVTADDLFDLYHAVPTPYRANGSWVLEDTSLRNVRKLKDGNDQYLWQPGLQAGAPDMLLGKPVYSDPDVATMAVDAISILFGDFSYYWIRDVAGIGFQRLNELYAANGQIGFRAWHRTDGKLLRAEAVQHYANASS